MKKILSSLIVISGIAILASCDSRECIKCQKISGTDTKELCSSDQNERNDFIVEWTYADYNCFQEEK